MFTRKKIFKIIRPIFELFKKTPVSAHIMFRILEKINSIYCAVYLKKESTTNFSNLDFKDDVLLICISFNNPLLIKKQIELFKKNKTSNHILIIADNSSLFEKRREISEICKEENILYINLPQNPRKQVNLNHSLALNWVYYNFVLKVKPFGFGFIDHDLFPLEKTNIKPILEEYEMYGFKQPRQSKKLSVWYLWAGFCFYRTSFIINYKPNFSSVVISNWYDHVGLDTGGGNFEKIYNQSKPKILFANYKNKSGQGELIDNWYHIGKASFKTPESIDKIIKNI